MRRSFEVRYVTLLANAPCPKCKRDTLHVKGECRDCGRQTLKIPERVVDLKALKEKAIADRIRKSKESYAAIARAMGSTRSVVERIARQSRIRRAFRGV